MPPTRSNTLSITYVTASAAAASSTRSMVPAQTRRQKPAYSVAAGDVVPDLSGELLALEDTTTSAVGSYSTSPQKRQHRSYAWRGFPQLAQTWSTTVSMARDTTAQWLVCKVRARPRKAHFGSLRPGPASRRRHSDRPAEVEQVELYPAEIGMLVVIQRKRKVQPVASQQRFLRNPLRHAPAQHLPGPLETAIGGTIAGNHAQPSVLLF